MVENKTPLPPVSDKSKSIIKWSKLTILPALVVFLSVLPLFLGFYWIHILIITFIYCIATVSMRTIMVSGQFPLGHAAFMGIGAYSAGMASKWLGLPPFLTIPIAALATSLIGMLIGYPFARLRALYYAMGSLFFGVGVMSIIYAGGRITGGYSGLTGIQPLFVGSKVPYFYFFLGLALISILALYRLEFSRIGINLKAVSQSHMVASSVGINEVKYRILAVGVGCFFVGLAGAGYAHYNLVLSSSSFDFLATLWLVMYVLIGGKDSFAGPIVGTFVLILVPEYFRDLKMYSPFIIAALLAIVAYLLPQGLVSLPYIIISRFDSRIKKRDGYAS